MEQDSLVREAGTSSSPSLSEHQKFLSISFDPKALSDGISNSCNAVTMGS